MRRTVPPSAEIEAQIDQLLAVGVGENPRESLSELAKLGARLIIQRAVEDEFDAWLGRARYERRPEYQRGLRNYESGLRNGFRPRTVQTAEGELEVEIPQVREAAETFVSKLFPRGTKLLRTEPLKAMVIGAFVRGLSMRDVESLAEKAGLGKLSKSTVQRICEELRERFEQCKRRDLYDIRLVALFLDATYQAVRPDGPKEGVLVAWGFTEQGERVLLSVMLGMRESYEDWLELGREHKGSHALAAVDEGTGKIRGHREIQADAAGHLAAVRWARSLDDERVWAIEDCRHVSRRFEQALLAAGERVVRVLPHRMGASRKGEREPGKSDQIDALALARAVVKDGVERFPVAFLVERAMEIRLLLDHRRDLVAERTRIVNRLCWHLLALCAELESSLKRGAFNHARVLDRVDRRLRKLAPGARVRIAREQLAQLRGLNRQLDQLRGELAELVAAHRPKLLAEQGCGTLTAAILIGRTAGNERFRSEAAFGLHTGTAPIPCSSGKRTQHRLNRGGDRQLNHALHIIAVTRAQHDPQTQRYLARKGAEGKTTKGALRSLKRHLARHFQRLLTEPPADQQPATNGNAINEPLPAAIGDRLPAIPPRPSPRRPVDPNIKGQAPFPMVCIS